MPVIIGLAGPEAGVAGDGERRDDTAETQNKCLPQMKRCGSKNWALWTVSLQCQKVNARKDPEKRSSRGSLVAGRLTFNHDAVRL